MGTTRHRYGAMALLALTGSVLVAAGGQAQAEPTAPTASATTTSTAPSPAEGHSPQITKALSGPISGTGLPRAGSSTTMSPAMRQATAAAANTMVNGIDVGSNQHPKNLASDINWTSVAGAGYQFAAIKATEANYYKNPFYASDANAARAAGLYVSAYAFANPFNSTATGNGTPQQQADYAFTNAGSYKVGGQNLPMMLDIEYDPYTASEKTNTCYGLSASAMVSWISAFMTEATAKTGATPIIYTTQDWWHTCTGNSTAFGKDVLWVASYSASTPGTLPAGWNTWNMWQYSSSGTVPGISVATDLDYFSGVPETQQTVVGTSASIQARTLNSLAAQAESYTATGLPAGTSISPSGQISGSPTTVGTYNVTVTPSGTGTAVPSSMSFTWNVLPRTVTMTSPGNQSTTAGSSVGLQVAATDNAGITPAFTATGLPPGLSISSGGKITGWPDTPGTYAITVTATDPTGVSASGSFTWTVSQAANSGATGKVVLANGGKCLDDIGSSTTNGNPIDIWTCNGSVAQSWTVVRDGTLRVRGKCLDVANGGTTNGTKVQLQTCTAGTASQRWQAGTRAELINAKSGLCLDDPGWNTANGTKLDIWACNGGAQQHWTLPAGPVLSGIAGKCVDDTSYSTSNGNKIQVYSCNGGGSQNWTLLPDGTLRVYGKCMDVTNKGTASGTKIQLYSCGSGNTAQQWKFTPTGDLAGELVNPASGRCLADPGDSASNGTQLQILNCSATDPGMSWNVR